MTESTFAGQSRQAVPSPIRVEQVQLDLLAPDPDQIRKHFDEQALQSLAESIKAQGLIQPIVVRPKLGNGTDYDYKIVAGERRYRAAKLAGIEHVPVIVRTDLANADIAVLQVLENLQRENLTLAETCAGVAKLVDGIGFARTCEQLGKSEAWVSKHAGVLKLRPEIVALVGEGRIESPDIARELQVLAELDAEEYGRLIERYRPGEPAPAVTAETLPDPAPTAHEEGERGSDAWAARRAVPPTRAEIRGAIFEIRAERMAEAEAAARRAKMAEQGEEYSEDASEAETSDDEFLADQLRGVESPEESAHERERRLKRQKLDALVAAGDKFCAEQLKRLGELATLPAGDQKDPDGHSEVVSIATPSSWSIEEAGAKDVLAIAYNIRVSTSVSASAPVLRALGIQGDLTVELDSLTLDQVQAIAKLVGRDFHLYTHRKLSGDQIFKALVAAGANAKPKPAARKTAKSGKNKASFLPIGKVADFLKATVTKGSTPAHRIKAGDLHARYVAWCAVGGFAPLGLAHNDWGKAIAAAGFRKIRSQGIQYTGIKLKAGAA